jgi:hypothetical protein
MIFKYMNIDVKLRAYTYRIVVVVGAYRKVAVVEACHIAAAEAYHKAAVVAYLQEWANYNKDSIIACRYFS